MNKNVLNLHSRRQDKGVQRHCFVFPGLIITQFSAGLVDGLKTDPWLGISDLWLCALHLHPCICIKGKISMINNYSNFNFKV